MHFLQNGSQVSPVPPTKPRTGTPGFFTESGVDNRPSYPGQDWFNAVIREFQGALSANGVAFDPEKYDHLTKLLAGNGSQFVPYRADREYATGETCTTVDATTGMLKIHQMYDGPNKTCIGKDPDDPLNRREGWPNYPTPFIWIEYTGKAPGETVWWGGADLPSFALQEMNQTVSAEFYWRLALARPELVSGADINLLDAAGRFVRAADGTTYIAGQTHEDGIRRLSGFISDVHCTSNVQDGGSLEFVNSSLNNVASGSSGQFGQLRLDTNLASPSTPQFQPVAINECKGLAI
ncbi:hypothetical protein [Aliivibrio wodanis]|uniref:hypothetical protein n=1 Tax=Aliivibrio wodanis TaxID=80852 RepID=UPI00406D4E5B